MKKPRQKTPRSQQLHCQDLASVRGGDNGVISSRDAHIGIVARDNGVINSRN